MSATTAAEVLGGRLAQGLLARVGRDVGVGDEGEPGVALGGRGRISARQGQAAGGHADEKLAASRRSRPRHELERHSHGSDVRTRAQLPGQDSNLEKQDQNLL